MMNRSRVKRIALRAVVSSAGLLLLSHCASPEGPLANATGLDAGVGLAGNALPLPESWIHGELAAAAPVSSVAHGFVRRADGAWVEPSLELVQETQEHLLRRFTQSATHEEQLQLRDRRANLLAQSADAASYQAFKGSYDVLVNAQLIEGLVAQQKPDDADSLLSVNAALASSERARLSKLEPEADLSGIGSQSQALGTTNQGQAYANECLSKGVPPPPDWGSGLWENKGVLTKEFLGRGYGKGSVWSFENSLGICLALPRRWGTGFWPIGVICQSNKTNKSCFWDTSSTAPIQPGELAPIVGGKFQGGAELYGKMGGRCSSCHAGENSFIIHPEDPVMMSVASKVKAKGWVTPLVDARWPQNAAPGKIVDSSNPAPPQKKCTTCHNKASGTRFPNGRGDIPEYCDMIDSFVSAGASGTMPPGAVGTGRTDYATHYNLVRSMCRTSSIPRAFGTSSVWHDFFAPNPEQPVLADFNGDGRADIGTFKRGTTNDVLVSLSTGNGFGAATLWHDFFGLNFEWMTVGDFNGDGKSDVVTLQLDGPAIVGLSNGSQFGPTALNWGGGPFPVFQEVLSGDFNNDRKDDLVRFTRGTTNDVFVSLSTGSSFGAPTKWHDFFGLDSESVSVGDFNGDANDDIIVFTGGNNGDVWVGLSNGTGSFTTSVWHSWFAVNNEVPAVADVNGDGFDDIVTFVRSTVTGEREGDVLVAFSNGKDGFHADKTGVGPGSDAKMMHDWFAIGTDRPFVADVNADERADLVAFTWNATADVWVALAPLN